MKKQKVKHLSASSLKDELIALLREQFNLRMQKGGGNPVKPHLL